VGSAPSAPYDKNGVDPEGDGVRADAPSSPGPIGCQAIPSLERASVRCLDYAEGGCGSPSWDMKSIWSQ
jgi:hypothetical protein